MARLLSLSSSSRSQESVTRALLSDFVSEWKAAHPQDSVLELDLLRENVPYVNELALKAIYTEPQARTTEQKDAFKLVERYTSALTDSDVYVMAVPMYNFTVPAVFKAFIDSVVIPGITFKMTSGGGYEGLLKNKRAFVITSSGGNYDQPPMAQMDFLEPYLRGLFGFLGVTDITFVKVQGHDAALVAREKENALAKIREYVKVSALVAAK